MFLRCTALAFTTLLIIGCTGDRQKAAPTTSSYLDYSGRDDASSGGARKIQIKTPKGPFHVWTKRVGNNPSIKVLLLHGGPGANHEYLEAFDSYFPNAGIEYYYYDQLGSSFSDQPHEPELWEVDRFVDEVEQVRQALGLDSSNFYLYGHSWGGVLAIEYALKHQEQLAGLIVSNMTASGAAYNHYADTVLKPEIDPAVLAEIEHIEAKGDINNPRYMELLVPHFYTKHLLRAPFEQWPEPLVRSFQRLNAEIYVPLQGPSELGISGRLASWDRSCDLSKITVPTLVIGARYDTMDPAHLQWMANTVQKGRYLYCAEGAHFAMYDDQKTYFNGMIEFINEVHSGRFER